jgi:hypothetical protein
MIREFPNSILRLANALATAASTQSQELRRHFSAAFVKTIGNVLICPGEYAVRLPDKRQVKVRVKQPLLVPREATQLGGTFQGNIEFSRVRTMLETTTGISRLITVEQACVAHFYYSEQTHGTDREGMIFGGRGASSYEVLREGPSQLTLCYLETKGDRSALAPSASDPKSRYFIHYRIMERV